MTDLDEKARQVFAEVCAISARIQLAARLPEPDPRLYPLATALREARHQALEEAARVADNFSIELRTKWQDNYCAGETDQVAALIRALKDTTP